jgi:hypothetical protein
MDILTKEIKSQLKELALKIPMPKYVGTKKILGSDILEDQSIALKLSAESRKSIQENPNKHYKINFGPAVNHFKRLIKAYEEGGVEGVNKYLEPFRIKNE